MIRLLNGNKTKSEIKSTTNNYIYFLQLSFAVVSKLFDLIYSKKNNNVIKVQSQKLLFT